VFKLYETDVMPDTFTIMLIGACAGLLALFAISGDLARRAGLTAPGRIMLSAGLGLGVLSISIKVFLVGFLMGTIESYHPESREDLPSSPIDPSATTFESVYTGRWYALPEAAPTPDGAPLEIERVKLGERLFNDPRLSADGTIACSTCHKLSSGGDDNASVSSGLLAQRGTRNAPSVWNAAFLSRLFWDGRAGSLEEQAKGPLVNPIEMGMPSYDAVVSAVARVPSYQAAFQTAFGAKEAITIDNITLAIADFERTLITPDTAYDRFVNGDASALTPQQQRGMALFAGLGCRGCHRDPVFSAAGKIKPAGIQKPFPIFKNSPYVAKYDLLADRGISGTRPTGLWRVPSLRSAADTAPYFHNGSVGTLEEAVRVMVATQLGRDVVPQVSRSRPVVIWDAESRKITPLRPKVLINDDITDLVAFLEALSPRQYHTTPAILTESRPQP